VCIHAIGDRAVRVILDVFERVAATNGPRDRRWRIEHAQHIAPSDLGRFSKLGVWASVQPSHAADDGRWCARAIGRERSEHGTYAFRSLLDSGARLAAGSDWFVAVPSPIAGIAAFVTRATLPSADTPAARAAPDRAAFVPAEAISVEEALRAYTCDASASVHEERSKGTIAEGLLADLVLLSRDIFTCAPGDIEDTRVALTVLGGAVVYDRDAELAAAHGDTEVARIGRAVQRGLPRCPCCH
jgi:predicted amidohydrolase YtcJ